ncbi:hypothetical protein HK405_015927, partial [Cladochytrium tenue]
MSDAPSYSTTVRASTSPLAAAAAALSSTTAASSPFAFRKTSNSSPYHSVGVADPLLAPHAAATDNSRHAAPTPAARRALLDRIHGDVDAVRGLVARVMRRVLDRGERLENLEASA